MPQDNFLREYDAVGNSLFVPIASDGSGQMHPTGTTQTVVLDQGTGLANPANDPVQPQSITGGVYNGIFIVGGGQIQSANFKSGSAGWQILSNGNVEFNAGTFRGAVQANSIDIPNTTTANSFHVDSMGNTWWGATTLANAVASITKAGVATFTSLSINGATVGQVATLIRDFTQSSVTNSSAAVKTLTISGNTLGANSALRITVDVSANTTGGGARVRLGGTDLTGVTFVAGASYSIYNIVNRNATNSQYYDGVRIGDSVNPKFATGTLTEDTTTSLILKLYDSGASGTFTVEGWVVELLK